MNFIYQGDNLTVLRGLPSESVDTIYTDPPFNTGKTQQRQYIRTRKSETGDRTGFKGERYATEKVRSGSFSDTFEDYLGFLKPRLMEMHRLLKPTGSLYLHLDHTEVHYVKVMLDSIFGRSNYMCDIVWGFEYGAKSKSKWPVKHNTILVFTKSKDYFFDLEAAGRVPYLAPGLVGPEKAARGKTLTTFQWVTIVSPTGKEKLGYPTQKPITLVRRFIRASTPKGGLVLDPFAGSGTTGAAALDYGCPFLLIDESDLALETMRKRFEFADVTYIDARKEGPLYSANANHSSGQ